MERRAKHDFDVLLGACTIRRRPSSSLYMQTKWISNTISDQLETHTTF